MKQRLSEASAGFAGSVTAVHGSQHFLSRAISIGIVGGSKLHVVQNNPGQPVLFYCRDSLIALSRRDCERIELEGGEA